MKTKLYTLLHYCAFVALGIGLTNCNKPFTPPDISGTWGKPDCTYLALSPDEEKVYTHRELLEKISTAMKTEQFNNELDLLVSTAGDYPQTFSIGADNAFLLTYNSGGILSGTCEQSGYSVYFFDPITKEYMYYAECNGPTTMTFVLGKRYTDESFNSLYYNIMNLFDLNEEERAAYEEVVIEYLMHISFSHTN